MGLLYWRTGRSTAQNGGFRPGQKAEIDEIVRARGPADRCARSRSHKAGWSTKDSWPMPVMAIGMGATTRKIAAAKLSHATPQVSLFTHVRRGLCTCSS